MKKEIDCFLEKPERCIKIACISHTGYVRGHNEDNYLVEGNYMEREHQSLEQPFYYEKELNEQTVFAVFDGMGGERAGELASYTAACGLAEMKRIEDLSAAYVTDVIRNLNRKVYTAGVAEKYQQIGTTLSMVILEDQDAYICNLGDSPVYLFREGKLFLVSRMHTNEEILKQMGITGRKPGLTQFLGISEEMFQIEPSLMHIGIQKDDIYMACSDGLTDMVEEEKIKEILLQDTTVLEKTEELKEQALENGGKDNITIILCQTV